ncbi:MAG: translation initiation factor IF-2 [Lachnospiraceae bacterium]|nr:translation initiation factor IF-2 [Lachnospiraceae bacterium]
MAKMQVMKLTKELQDQGINVSNKSVLEFLSSKGAEVANHMSAIDDREIALVREHFGAKAEKKEPAQSDVKTADNSAAKAEAGEPKAGDSKAQGDRKGAEKKQAGAKPKLSPKKKKNIIFAVNNNVGRAGGRYGSSTNRQIVHISNGKIEQPKARKPFKHTEVASPEALGLTRENPEKKLREQEEAPVAAEVEVKKEVAEIEAVSEVKKEEKVKQEAAVTESVAVPAEKEGKKETLSEAEKQKEKPEEKAKEKAGEAAAEPSGDKKEKTEKTEKTEKVEKPEKKEEKTAEEAATKPSPIRKIYGNVYSNMAKGEGRGNAASKSGQTGRSGNVGRENKGREGRSFGAPEGNVYKGNARAQAGGGAFGGTGNRAGSQRGAQRPGAFGAGQGGRGGFENAPSGKGQQGRRSDADRRRQSEARRRKNAVLEASMSEEGKGRKINPHGFHKPAPVEKPKEDDIKVISIPDSLTIKDLADRMKIQPSAIVKKLFLSGQVVTLNSEVSFEEAEDIASEYEILCEHEKTVDVIEELLREEEDKEEKLKKRPPVVCVMGHVDHGKTSLLDKIRSSRVTEKESGGITQAIGAYMVDIKGRKITFLDTPGHEAFTAMRMRGATATDIAVLVVAADDGVMPQTVEAINHARAANVEIIVAINKIDKPGANLDRVKQELSEHELIPEDWGGSTVFVPVSAKTGEGIDQLLEMILLSADIMELKADPDRQARGLVIEARLDKGRGPVTTILVQKGTLHVGDFVAVGPCHGRVRAMLDENGKRIKEATPSTPAEILGLDDVPEAGEIFVSPETDKEAKSFADTFKEQHKKELLNETKQRMSLDDLYSQIKEGDLKEFNVIIKADVQGSVEALKTSLLKLSNDEVALKVIHGGVGAINESDVSLASASNAIILGFNVRPDQMAKQTAESQDVDIRLYKVIYQAIEDVEAAMKGRLAPVFEEKVIGHVEVRQIFKASQIGNIAGSYVLDGIVERGCSVRVSRDGEQIFEGQLASLKRFKDDVKEVREGYECGLMIEDFNDIQELDQVECYKMVEVERQ